MLANYIPMFIIFVQLQEGISLSSTSEVEEQSFVAPIYGLPWRTEKVKHIPLKSTN